MRLTIAACLLLAAPAVAQDVPPCAPRNLVVAQLAEKYGETLRSLGMAADVLVETYAAPSGTWTTIHTTADGIACMVAAGDMFEAIAVPTGDPA